MKTMRPASSSSSRSTNNRARSIPGTRALKGISNKALLSRIRKLSETERKTVLSILVHLIEIDRRNLYVPLGFSSLFEFCREHLGYSESTAGRRIKVARCLGDFPQVYSSLASGKLSMTNLAMITKIITPQNVSELLSRIEGASKTEVELLVNSRRPRSAIRDSVTPVYVKTVIEVACDAPGSQGGKKTTATGGGKISVTSEGSGPAPATESGRGPASTELQVVLEERLKITFGADPGFMKKVERIRALLSSKHHGWIEFEELFSILMDEYIERHSPEGRIRRKSRREQKKIGKESNKTASQTVKGDSKKQKRASGTAAGGPQKKENSRYIPQKVRDEVYARDKGRCTFVSPGGRRCGSKWDLQIDHKVPFARGGDNSPSNLRLLCGKHNRLEAEKVYGKKHMERYVKEHAGLYGLKTTDMKKTDKYVKEQGEQYCAKKMEQYIKEYVEQFCLEQADIGKMEKYVKEVGKLYYCGRSTDAGQYHMKKPGPEVSDHSRAGSPLITFSQKRHVLSYQHELCPSAVKSRHSLRRVQRDY